MDPSPVDRYPVHIFYSEDDDGYFAVVPALAGCSGFGKTQEEALAEARFAIIRWLDGRGAGTDHRPAPVWTRVRTLRENLGDWNDVEGAGYALAQCLGLLDPEVPYSDTKYLFWSANPLGDALIRTLDDLVRLGVLEEREDDGGTVYRWDPAFKGRWEAPAGGAADGNGGG